MEWHAILDLERIHYPVLRVVIRGNRGPDRQRGSGKRRAQAGPEVQEPCPVNVLIEHDSVYRYDRVTRRTAILPGMPPRLT